MFVYSGNFWEKFESKRPNVLHKVSQTDGKMKVMSIGPPSSKFWPDFLRLGFQWQPLENAKKIDTAFPVSLEAEHCAKSQWLVILRTNHRSVDLATVSFFSVKPQSLVQLDAGF